MDRIIIPIFGFVFNGSGASGVGVVGVETGDGRGVGNGGNVPNWLSVLFPGRF
jgi:hypothetical protein